MLQKISLAINVLLIAAVAWLFVLHHSSDENASNVSDPETEENQTQMNDSLPDVGKDVNAKIAYFEMDSIIGSYKLMKEKTTMLQLEEKRLTRKVERERAAAQQRYNELMNKDRTYSTNAELEADQMELEGLMAKVQQLEESSMNDLVALQQDVMIEIVQNLQNFLSDYNEEYGFDYIVSMQQDGQIWSGNPSLDITRDVLNGLNERHAQKKAESEVRKAAKSTE